MKEGECLCCQECKTRATKCALAQRRRKTVCGGCQPSDLYQQVMRFLPESDKSRTSKWWRLYQQVIRFVPANDKKWFQASAAVLTRFALFGGTTTASTTSASLKWPEVYVLRYISHRFKQSYKIFLYLEYSTFASDTNFTYLLRYKEDISAFVTFLCHVFHTLQHYIFNEITEVLPSYPTRFCDRYALRRKLRQITATDCDFCINLWRSAIVVCPH